jgi:hypothetical protein
MAESVSDSSTPSGIDPHRRAPDPAGTRPKVDVHAVRPAAIGPPPAPAGQGQPPPGATDQTRPGPTVDGAKADSSADQAGLGETFGQPAPSPRQSAPLDSTAAPARVAPAAAVAAHPAGAASRGDAARVETPHGPRFQFLIGGLVALAISALAITFLTLRAGRDTVPADWASWRPSATGFAAAAQIAAHVGPEYRLASNAQMVAIQSGPLALDGVPLTLVLKTSASTDANAIALPGNAVLFKMCGLGPSCAIVGTPSAERLALVRREALELALNTFEYVANADQVVVFLPPVVPAASVGAKKPAAAATDALMFQASDFRSELDRPLSTTLAGRPPTISTVDKASDTPVVTALTKPAFYSFSIVPQAAEATVYLVLSPLMS